MAMPTHQLQTPHQPAVPLAASFALLETAAASSGEHQMEQLAWVSEPTDRESPYTPQKPTRSSETFLPGEARRAQPGPRESRIPPPSHLPLGQTHE